MLTEKRDLRTGKPVWQKRRGPALKSDRLPGETDVLVVGTGISGALVADALLHAGLRVAAVDRRDPMTGSTPASSSLLLFELDTPLTILTQKAGLDRAAMAWLRSADAVRALGERISDLGIACDCRERCTVYLPGDVLSTAGLRQETDARRQLGLRSEFVGRAELRRRVGINQSGAIFSRGNAEVNPIKLVEGLWRRVRAAGGKVIYPFDAVELEESNSKVSVRAADGRRIIARHVVLCSGYELPKSVEVRGLKVFSTWVIATKPQRRNLWPGRELVWQAADPYLYMRTTPAGRVIAGGADETFSDEDKRDALIEQKSARIAKLVSRIFPKIDFTPSHAWTGSFGDSETGMPAIGLLPGYRRCYGAFGFGGNGFTFSMLAAQVISRSINGITDPHADVFAL